MKNFWLENKKTKSLLKFKGKFQEANSKCRGRLYPLEALIEALIETGFDEANNAITAHISIPFVNEQILHLKVGGINDE